MNGAECVRKTKGSFLDMLSLRYELDFQEEKLKREEHIRVCHFGESSSLGI